MNDSSAVITGWGSASATQSDEEGVWPSVVVDKDLGRAEQEWLHTNGAGAYASSTLACMHTRRYHGLLVAALDEPRGRHVFLSHIDATLLPSRSNSATSGPPSVRSNSPRWELARHQFPGVDPKEGPFYMTRFDQDPLPRWTYDIPLGRLSVTLALVRGQNAAVLRYVWQGASPVLLRLRPLLAARSFHSLQREHGGMLQRVEIRSLYDSVPRSSVKVGEMRVQPRRELPRVCFRYEGTFVGSPDWWRRFEYLTERDRGADFEEDLWTPGVFEVLLGDTPSYLVAAVEKLPQGEPEALLGAAEASLRAEDPGPNTKPIERRLAIAAEAFRADLARRPGVIAGYPWFEVWGRDTLLSLPGLYLVPKRFDGAMRILREVIASMQGGLIPNQIGDATEAQGPPAPDATLWLFEVARLLADALGERHPFVTDELLLALRDAFDAALAGTRYGIHITEEGLFAVGNAGDALTWMDARTRARPMPPYAGCPVELSALWARGCDTLARLARAAGDNELMGRAQAECWRARAAFQARFWCDETGYPYDVISEHSSGAGAFRDASIRPYAVIALAVDPECFAEEQRSHVIDRARQELVTQAGLRTLAPSDPSYMGHYGGGVETDDRTYHQGAVYPWLLGFFVRAARQSGAEGEHLIPLLERLVASATANALALGQVPEIADGEPPHTPAGCIAQAFSVAELLRAVAWDLR